jgi:peptide/nickel transport system ATP-binding protein
VGLAILGHTRRGARIAGGSVRVDGQEILKLSRVALKRRRGKLVSYVPQDPASALNPALRIEKQLREILDQHDYGGSAAARRTRLEEMLVEVMLPSDAAFLRRYPHQLSGGQQQRVGLAIAFACRPRVIVLDEPTTGLDVTTQAHVLETVRGLCRTHQVAAVYVTHDLAVVATLAHRVAVMYAGRIVETGTQHQLFTSAAHPYTRRLLQAIPDISGRYELVGIPGRAPPPGLRPTGCFFAPRCELAVERCIAEFPSVTQLPDHHETRCHRAEQVLSESVHVRPRMEIHSQERRRSKLLSIRQLSASYGANEVVHGVDIDVWPHECLALVGESGSGKTTLARCIAGLHTDFVGDVALDGRALPAGSRARDQETRRLIQYIFQSPYSSLNPRKTIGQIVSQPLQLFFDLSRRAAEKRAAETLERVSLSPRLIDRYADQLSGGERQRVAIARALAAEPSLLICDEVTSALDVSVQAVIVDLLADLQRETGVGLLFVTHNLALVRTIAQEVTVMENGRIVEFGRAEDMLATPKASYTRRLLENTPSLDSALSPVGVE